MKQVKKTLVSFVLVVIMAVLPAAVAVAHLLPIHQSLLSVQEKSLL